MKMPIDHGVTNHEGLIKLFNAEAGDTILSTHEDFGNWRYKKVIVAPAKKNTGSADMIVELETVSGQFSLLSGLAFDATGTPVYQCLADPVFSSPPSSRCLTMFPLRKSRFCQHQRETIQPSSIKPIFQKDRCSSRRLTLTGKNSLYSRMPASGT